MNDQHYAPPSANLQPESGNIMDLLTPLVATKGWVRLCSIMGFIFGVLMIIAGLGLMAGGAASAAIPFGIGLGVAYMLMGLLYFVPSVYLFRYASAIALAQSSENMADITIALTHQKSFWKFAGIMTLIMLVFMVLGMVSAIVIPIMAN